MLDDLAVVVDVRDRKVVTAIQAQQGKEVHLAWQLYDVDIDDAPDCDAKFRSNRFVGWILFISIVVDRF